MKLVILGMHRSGHNAIARWLLRQSSLNNKKIYPLFDNWVEGFIPFGAKSYGFISQINHPEHYKLGTYDNEVITIERETVEAANNIVKEYNLQSYKKIIVLRDFKNWLASIITMEINNGGNFSVLHIDLLKYFNHIKYILQADYNDDWLYISYNKWHSSLYYRKHIVDRQLKLKWTDSGKNDVNSNGGGSSFDGTQYDKQANKMDVLNRWKQYENNEFFNKILSNNIEILQLSDKLFGKYGDV